MADSDKLWFELGVRDEVSKVLEELMKKSDKLAISMSDISDVTLKNFYKNANDIAQVFDKIHVTQRRIHDTLTTSTGKGEKQRLQTISSELDKLEKKYKKMWETPDSMSEKGFADVQKNRDAIEVMIRSTLRYVDELDAQERAEAKHAANESKRIDDLKQKYYELQRYRKNLTDAIVNAAPGADLSNAGNLVNAISSRMSAVKRAERNGTGLPASTTGADYDEFLRKIKAELSGLTSATDSYNRALETNKQIQSALNKMSADATSQQKIAGIRKQTVEYAALGRKIQEIQNLINNISNERGLLLSGRITTPTWTNDKVVEELNAIQRRYNESIAAGRQRELDDAAAKNQRANAAKRAADAIGMLAHVNDGLTSSYYRIAEAGNQASRITVQLQNQIGAYAGLYGLERILKSVVTIGGQFEFQHIALQNILGDVEQANTLFAQLQDLAIESPKTFMELTAYTKQLSAYQIPYNELFDTTKRLADISTGLGVDMNRLILAYGQVRSAAVLRGQELRQFTEAGIPMVQKLAEKFSDLNGRMVTTGEVFELISKRAVPFKMVQEVLWDMTNEGGQFFDMQSKLADTLYGKYQKLQDSWQIMLGRIADGESIAGKFFKVAIEGAVGFVSVLDSLMPVLGMMGMGKLLNGIYNYSLTSYRTSTGGTAIRNMELAKIKEANRLERERVWYGKQLKTEELKLVQNKNKLVSSDYAILAFENQITERKAYELMLAGQMEKSDFFRLLQLKNYTRQQRVAIANASRLEALNMLNGGQSMWSKMKNSVLGFAGGWTGVAFAAIGGVVSLYERASEQAKRAGELAGSATGSMLENLNSVNNLYNSLNKERPKNTEEMTSAIERMTNALKNSGNYSEELNNQIQGTDNLTEKYRILFGELERVSNEYLVMRDNVQAYIAAANQSGEGNWFTKLFNDNMAEDLTEWSKANIAKNVAKKGVDRMGASIKTELKNFYKDLGKWNEEEMRTLDWQTLFDKLSDKERSDFKVSLGRKSGNLFLNESERDYWEKAEEAIQKYIRSVYELSSKEAEVDAQMQEYADHIEIAVNESLKAQGLNPATISEWDNEGLMKFRDSINNVLNSYELDGETKERFRDKLYHQLLSEPMIVKIKALPAVEEQDLAPWQQDLKNYFEKNKIRINIDAQSSLEKVEKDLQNKHKEMQESLERNGKILIRFGFDLSSLPTDIEKGLTPLAPEWRNYVSKILQDYNNDKAEDAKVVQAGKDLGLNINKKNTSGGGNKKDTELERIKNRVDLYKKFYTEFENYTDLYGKAGALNKLRKDGEFSAVFGWDNVSDLTNYKKTIGELTAELKNNSEARDKFLNSSKADIQARQRKEETEAIKEYISELQRMMNVMSENYQTYKKWVDLTGDAELAAKVAGVTQNTSMSDWLTDQMNNALKKTNFALSAQDVFGLSETDAKKLGKDSEIFKIWEWWQDNQKKIKKEQWDLYEEAYKGAKNYDDKIADVNRRLAKELEAINAISRSEEERSRLTQNREENASREISKIQWEKFKDENDWGEVFSDIKNVPLDKLKKLVKAMRELRVNINLNVQEMKEFQKGLNDSINEIAEKDSLEAISKAITNLTDAQKRYSALEMRGEAVRRGYDKEFKNEKEYNKALKQAENAITEARKSLVKAVKAFANDLKSLGSTFNSLSKTFGSNIAGDILGGFGTIFDGLGKSMDAISNIDFQKKGFSGLVNKIGGVASVITAMIDMNQMLSEILPSSQTYYEHYAAKAREVNKLREAVDDYRIAVAEARAEESEWFAGNSLSSLKANGDKAKETLSAYYKELYENQEPYEPKGSGLARWAVPIAAAVAGIALGVVTGGAGFAASFGIIGSAVTSGIATGLIAEAIGVAVVAGVSSAVGQIAQSAYESITYKDGEIDARRNMFIQTQHSSFWRGEKVQNLEEWTRENIKDKYGKPAELFDKEGLVNLEAAEQILEKYGNKLVGDTQETLQRLVDLRKEYDEFINQIQDYASQIGTSLADNMTDALWDWLSDGENALDKFREYASDTWKQVAQDIIKTFYKVTVLDKYAEAFESLFKEWGLGGISDEQLIEKFATLSGMIVNDFETATPMAERLLTMLNDSFEQNGYDITNSDSGSSSSSKSIQNVTESTADLLASYLNAIRADTSVNRVTLSQILIAVQTQAEMPVIARAQLQQLQVIAGNTGRNVEIVDSIYNLLHGLAPDGTALKIM